MYYFTKMKPSKSLIYYLKKMKPSKSSISTPLIVKMNLAFLVLLVTVTLTFQPSYLFKNSPIKILKVENRNFNGASKTVKTVIKEAPEVLQGFDENTRIGLVNMRYSDAKSIGMKGNLIPVDFEPVSSKITWENLFPKWIKEEFEPVHQSTCPTIPMPDFSVYEEMDLVVAQLPCRQPEPGWNRDVTRLQAHLVAASMAVRKGKRNENGMVKLAFKSRCEPMREIFRCDDLKKKDGTWWMYEIDAMRLEEKVRSPPGTCGLILPLPDEGSNKGFDVEKNAFPQRNNRREAYVTVLHSSDAYVCGVIVLAYNIRKAGSTRDLVLLHDEFINSTQLQALRTAGWSPRQIERIRNPHPRPDGLFQYNLSKFRIFQLTDYDKVVFIDADIAVLRNLDILFSYPSISACVDHEYVFNSGVMVVEPSNCTFETMMSKIQTIESYNGGDQGFLNEIFVWWHRLPRRTNFFKGTWSNTTHEKMMLDSLFKSDPPKLYAIHYFGLKPWMCYRDYDCNWLLGGVRKYANDEAHWKWWQLYDRIDDDLKDMCRLSAQQKSKLNLFTYLAAKTQYSDGHWKLKITDPRKDL